VLLLHWQAERLSFLEELGSPIAKQSNAKVLAEVAVAPYYWYEVALLSLCFASLTLSSLDKNTQKIVLLNYQEFSSKNFLCCNFFLKSRHDCTSQGRKK
jgi:hypothetical protein